MPSCMATGNKRRKRQTDIEIEINANVDSHFTKRKRGRMKEIGVIER